MCASNTKIYPTILCGGSGARLWPLSRAGFPKQFLNLIDEKTLFQKTYARAKDLSPHLDPIVVTAEAHKYIVAEQLGKLGGKANVLCEPVSKNTCPAITVAAMEIQSRDPEAVMLVLPSDHLIENQDALLDAVNSAFPLAQSGKLVTFGIKPTEPHPGFGYIKVGAPIQNGFKVDRFTEKPNRLIAESYLEQGGYMWNCGIFLFTVNSFLKQVAFLAPDIYEFTKKAYRSSKQEEDFIKLEQQDYMKCPEDSIDFAIMEKSKNVAVIPLDIEWTDIGSWSALDVFHEKDHAGNSKHGDVFLRNTRQSFVRSESRLVAVSGMENILVVETPDVVMVTPKDKDEEVKDLVSDLRKHGRAETHQSLVVQRPWGTFEPLARGKNYQVKRIIVYPGQSLSLQKHKFRSEHWTVVVGKGVVNLDDTILELTADESVYIPAGSKHRLSNRTRETLEIIEVQTGSYLGEDDIIRYEDTYGRVDNNT